jgi:hypothetical protein
VNRAVPIAILALLAACVACGWAIVTSGTKPTRNVQIELASAELAPDAMRPDLTALQVSLLVRNQGPRAALVILSGARTAPGAENTIWLGQECGLVPGRSERRVDLKINPAADPNRVEAMVYEQANVLEKASVAAERLCLKTVLGANAGRGPHLVDDQYLEGYQVTSSPLAQNRTQK